ncbi:hypothetical protein AWRI1631_45980, partial [Saccharomyces cerevisiae AWRI1631]
MAYVSPMTKHNNPANNSMAPPKNINKLSAHLPSVTPRTFALISDRTRHDRENVRDPKE